MSPWHRSIRRSASKPWSYSAVWPKRAVSHYCARCISRTWRSIISNESLKCGGAKFFANEAEKVVWTPRNCILRWEKESDGGTRTGPHAVASILSAGTASEFTDSRADAAGTDHRDGRGWHLGRSGGGDDHGNLGGCRTPGQPLDLCRAGKRSIDSGSDARNPVRGGGGNRTGRGHARACNLLQRGSGQDFLRSVSHRRSRRHTSPPCHWSEPPFGGPLWIVATALEGHLELRFV